MGEQEANPGTTWEAVVLAEDRGPGGLDQGGGRGSRSSSRGVTLEAESAERAGG